MRKDPAELISEEHTRNESNEGKYPAEVIRGNTSQK
jgi:hypothetical protein